MKNDIDLHIHSDASDGTYGVKELLSLVRENGIVCFSVTDHDTLSGVKRLNELLKTTNLLNGLSFFTGVEFSCRYKDVDLHLLGYAFDADNKALNDLTEEAKQKRRLKISRLSDYLLKEHGIRIPEEEVKSFYRQNKNVGKPDFANVIVKMGIENDVDTVFEKYLNGFEAGDLKTDVKDAIEAVADAHGLSVLAHPLIITEDYGYTYSQIDGLTGELKAFGLDGLEVYYGKHSSRDKAEYAKIAEKYRLFTSGGSDFHGKNKPRISLGDLGEGMDEKAHESLYEFVLEMLR